MLPVHVINGYKCVPCMQADILGDWREEILMAVNGEAIFGTVPWKVCGEGPQVYRIDRIRVEGHNERSLEKPTLDDIRYTASKDGIKVLIRHGGGYVAIVNRLGK